MLAGRYANMDYIFVAAILLDLATRKLITYDIACQWSVHLLDRISKFPDHLRINIPTGHLAYAIPKLHWHSHNRVGHSKFSLNLIPGVGRTDGEGIERLWLWLNKAAPSAKEMTPAARHELLDDFCGFTNWRKTIGLCDILARRMLDALKYAKAHRDELIAFSARVRQCRPEQLEEWERMVKTWKRDPTSPCPYTPTTPRS